MPVYPDTDDSSSGLPWKCLQRSCQAQMVIWIMSLLVVLFDPVYYDTPIAPRELYDPHALMKMKTAWPHKRFRPSAIACAGDDTIYIGDQFAVYASDLYWTGEKIEVHSADTHTRSSRMRHALHDRIVANAGGTEILQLQNLTVEFLIPSLELESSWSSLAIIRQKGKILFLTTDGQLVLEKSLYPWIPGQRTWRLGPTLPHKRLLSIAVVEGRHARICGRRHSGFTNMGWAVIAATDSGQVIVLCPTQHGELHPVEMLLSLRRRSVAGTVVEIIDSHTGSKSPRRQRIIGMVADCLSQRHCAPVAVALWALVGARPLRSGPRSRNASRRRRGHEDPRRRRDLAVSAGVGAARAEALGESDGRDAQTTPYGVRRLFEGETMGPMLGLPPVDAEVSQSHKQSLGAETSSDSISAAPMSVEAAAPQLPGDSSCGDKEFAVEVLEPDHVPQLPVRLSEHDFSFRHTTVCHCLRGVPDADLLREALQRVLTKNPVVAGRLRPSFGAESTWQPEGLEISFDGPLGVHFQVRPMSAELEAEVESLTGERCAQEFLHVHTELAEALGVGRVAFALDLIGRDRPLCVATYTPGKRVSVVALSLSRLFGEAAALNDLLRRWDEEFAAPNSTAPLSGGTCEPDEGVEVVMRMLCKPLYALQAVTEVLDGARHWLYELGCRGVAGCCADRSRAARCRTR
eukprot:s1842_g1.t1